MSTQTGSVEVREPTHSGAPRWYGWEACLGNVNLFKELSRKDLERVARLAEARFFPNGKVIVRAGSVTDSKAFFAIVEGRARVETPSGHARMLETYESFGELGLLDGAPRSATVTAAGDVRLACIKGPAFRELLRKEPAVASGILRSLVAIVRDIQAEVAATPETGRLVAASAKLQDEYGEEWSLPQKEAVPILAGVPLFGSLSKRHLRRIAAQVQLHTHPGGAVVLKAGKSGGWYFHIILEGSARVVLPDHDVVLGRGDYFGELALIDDAPRAADVVAEGELRTLQISRGSFSQLLRDEPAVTLGLIRGLVAIIRDLQRSA